MRAWDGKRILVTGGAGFIGSHLVDNLLSEGVEHVAVVDNFFLGKESNLSQATKKYKDKGLLAQENSELRQKIKELEANTLSTIS